MKILFVFDKGANVANKTIIHGILVLIILLITAVRINAQKWERNDMDDFTGERVRITKYEVVAFNQIRVRFSVVQYGDYYYLRVRHAGTNVQDDLCKDGETNLILRFLDSSTHTLFPTDEFDCGRNLIINYPLDKEDMEKLEAKGIEMFRIYYTNGFVDYEMFKVDYFMRTLAFFN